MSRLNCTLAMLAALAASAPTRAAQSSMNATLPDVLAAAGDYIEQYERQFSAVVSEERYYQTASPGSTSGPRQRNLRSDLMVINGGQAGWIVLRDVFEVDGAAVRDHTDRLLKLITSPSDDAFDQASRLTAESARFNIGVIQRTINVPTLALGFLRRDAQPRLSFTLDGQKTIDGVRVSVLSYKEHATPRLVHTVDDAPVAGKFWVEPVSGRVVQSELSVVSRGTSARITVRYADQPKLKMWVPVSMDEEYLLGGPGTPMFGRGTISGRADYRNFRKFDVDVATIIK